jgi:hypothetical protein
MGALPPMLGSGEGRGKAPGLHPLGLPGKSERVEGAARLQRRLTGVGCTGVELLWGHFSLLPRF